MTDEPNIVREEPKLLSTTEKVQVINWLDKNRETLAGKLTLKQLEKTIKPQFPFVVSPSNLYTLVRDANFDLRRTKKPKPEGETQTTDKDLAKRVVRLEEEVTRLKHEVQELRRAVNIKPECMFQLNRVIQATGCKLILSSAWRYMILNKAMTLRGMAYLLLTHGLYALEHTTKGWDHPLVDFLDEDTSYTDNERAQGADKTGRGKLIRGWLNLNSMSIDHEVISTQYACVDDMDLGYTHYGHPHVITKGDIGLTPADADALIALLS